MKLTSDYFISKLNKEFTLTNLYRINQFFIHRGLASLSLFSQNRELESTRLYFDTLYEATVLPLKIN